jgi:hypothetical protein
MVTIIPSPRYGIPAGTAGRRGFPILGIVIHCLDVTLDEYAKTCGSPGKLSRGLGNKASLHYGISLTGGVQQYVHDSDMAWGLDFTVPLGSTTPYYNCPSPCGPSQGPCDEPITTSNYTLLWDLLTQAANENIVIPAGTGPDFYLLHIGVESPAIRTQSLTGGSQDAGCNGCTDELVAKQFSQIQYRMLIQLVAFLADRYSIPLNDGRINFFHNIDPCDREECGCPPCGDQFVCAVQNYCQPAGVTQGADANIPVTSPDVMSHLYGQDIYGGRVAVPVSSLLLSNIRLNTATGKIEIRSSSDLTVWTPINEV